MTFHSNTGEVDSRFFPQGMAIHVLVFKTNLQYKKDVAQLQPVLGNLPGIIRWNVDRQDIDHVLRVEALQVPAAQIIALVNKLGYYCEELPD